MHETMNEPSRDEVIDRAIGFIDPHTLCTAGRIPPCKYVQVTFS